MLPYPWSHVGTPSPPGHLDRVSATLSSRAPARAAQGAPELGQSEGQGVLFLRPSACIVKGGVPRMPSYPTQTTVGSKVAKVSYHPALREAGPKGVSTCSWCHDCRL